MHESLAESSQVCLLGPPRVGRGDHVYCSQVFRVAGLEVGYGLLQLEFQSSDVSMELGDQFGLRVGIALICRE